MYKTKFLYAFQHVSTQNIFTAISENGRSYLSIIDLFHRVHFSKDFKLDVIG